jgi:hypothetical protein
MNSTQNDRINQITSSTLIVGVDMLNLNTQARKQDYHGVNFWEAITLNLFLDPLDDQASWTH